VGAVEESVAEAQHAIEALRFEAARGPSETNHLALLGVGEAFKDSANLTEAEVSENVTKDHTND
jgi:hypothetical protein